MQLVQELFLWPNACFRCHSVATPQVDTQLDVDLIGSDKDTRVYLCTTCLNVAGRLVGMATTDEVQKLSDRIAEQAGEIDRLGVELSDGQSDATLVDVAKRAITGLAGISSALEEVARNPRLAELAGTASKPAKKASV